MNGYLSAVFFSIEGNETEDRSPLSKGESGFLAVTRLAKCNHNILDFARPASANRVEVTRIATVHCCLEAHSIYCTTRSKDKRNSASQRVWRSDR